MHFALVVTRSEKLEMRICVRREGGWANARNIWRLREMQLEMCGAWVCLTWANDTLKSYLRYLDQERNWDLDHSYFIVVVGTCACSAGLCQTTVAGTQRKLLSI